MTIDYQPVTLPNEPQFKRLVRHCIESPKQVAVYDEGLKIEASYEQMFQDIQATRRSLVNSLPRSIFGSNRFIISEKQTLFVCILAPGNYEFIVAALSVLATGGALVPFVPSISPEEATHPLQLSNSTCLLASSALLKRAVDIQRHQLSLGRKLAVLPIQTGISSVISPTLVVDDDAVIGADRPCLVVFTSGTTGPPKGVVIPRSLLDKNTKPSKDFVTLCCRPPNHLGACGTMLSTIFTGGTLDIVPRDAAVLWERLCKWDSTALKSTPPLWQQMMDVFQERIAYLPTGERDQYIRGLRNLRSAGIYGAVASPSLLKFWRDLGQTLTSIYGSTEAGGLVLMSTNETNPHLKDCIGRPISGVMVRLTEGDEGELLIKAPAMFTHFLGDDAATEAAFTEDGFYKTGDLVRRVGADYVILGRASTDFIRYYGHRIPVLELESYLADIPSVAEAYVLSVPDPYTCARVAVLVRFDPNTHSAKNEFNLGYIRAHLSDKLASYKLPTLMRTLQKGETIHRTEIGKIIRKKISEKFFPLSETFTLPPEIEVWDDDNIKNNNIKTPR